MKTTGYVGADGVYRRQQTAPPITALSATYKDWDHERQRRQFARDLIQPYLNGRINPEFRAEYPKEVKQYDKTA